MPLLAALLVLTALPGGCGGGGLDRPIRRALALIRSKDRADRLDAVQRLGRSQGKELHAVPPLIRALSDPDPEVQKLAAMSLRTLLRRPDLPDSRTVWEEEWRRRKTRIEKDKDLTSAERLKKEKAKLKNDEGFLHMARGDFQQAEALFLEAVAQDPDNATYWNNLGKCNANEGRWPIAVDRCLKALELDPGYGAARYNLAEAYLKISKLTRSDRSYEALGHVEEAIRLDTNGREWSPRWLKARIFLHMAMSESRPAERIEIYRRAAEAIEKAKKIAPKIAEIRKTAALIAYGRELYYAAYKEVAKLYELGYEMDPGFLEKLGGALRREAYARGLEPPKMPGSPEKPRRRGSPPSLRTPYGRPPGAAGGAGR